MLPVGWKFAQWSYELEKKTQSSAFTSAKDLDVHLRSLGIQGETEDKEGQQMTAHLMLQPAAVGWRWQQPPGQASQFSISWPQKSFQGQNILGCQS